MKRFIGLGPVFFIGVFSCASAFGDAPLQLQAGFVYRIHCQGRLLVSAVGDDRLLRLEALPKEMGCGALIKPLQSSGKTNLILETSAGSIVRLVELLPLSSGRAPSLEIKLDRETSR
jgi:hypothetical protein